MTSKGKVMMKKYLLPFLAIAAMAAPSQAHRQWMLPSSTILSGNDVWVTVDAAVSSDVFFMDHQPLRLDNVKATAPDGSDVPLENASTGRYRSVFDVHLTQKGTYRIANMMSGVMGSYKVGGEQKRLPRGTTAEQLATLISADATDVQVTEGVTRNEVFVTSGAPTTTLFKPTGMGLELAPVTHPNDLVVGEDAIFRFLVDGKPAANLEVNVVPGGVRYRNTLNDRTLTTDANGEVRISWPEPGYYWINASVTDGKTSVKGATRRRLGYISTVEVQAP
jgi:uncharacterized GH25 family protein